MALTRPTIQNINTNLTTFTDSLTVTNFGNIANRDIGEVFDRSQGGGSNVAIFWNESTQSFRMSYTSSTGTDTGNLVITSNANVTLGNVTSERLTVGNLVINGSSTFAAGLSADQLTSSNSTVQLYSNTQTAINLGGSSTTVNIASTNRSSSTSTGALVVAGGVGIAGNAYIGGNLVVAGNVLVSNVIYQNTEYVSSTEVVAGNSTVNGLSVNTSATIGTTLSATGGIQNTVIGNVTAAPGTFTTVTATSSVNGPLNGTLGSAGGNTAIISTLTTTGNATINGLTVNAGATIGTTLGVAGNAIVGNLTTGTGTGGTITGANLISANFFAGNGSGLTSITGANVTGFVPNATSATTAGTVTTAAQPNITSVGTLTSLTVSGPITGNTIAAANFGNNGANFTGAIFNAAGSFYGPISGVLGGGGANTALVTTLTSTGNTTVSALILMIRRTTRSTLGVTGNVIAGNISTTTLSATSINGSFSGTSTITSGSISGLSGGTASYTTVGSQTLRVSAGGMAIGGDSYLVNSLGIGQHLYVAGNSNISGNTVISDIAKLNIPGGTAGYTIKTDGSGNLYWAVDNTGSITFTTGLAPPTSGNVKGDQWYNTATDAIYEYTYDGLNYYWVDISGAAFGNSSGTGDALSPFLLMGA